MHRYLQLVGLWETFFCFSFYALKHIFQVLYIECMIFYNQKKLPETIVF